MIDHEKEKIDEDALRKEMLKVAALRLRVEVAEGLLRRVRRVAMSESFHLTSEPNARERGIATMGAIDEFLDETPSGTEQPQEQEVARG